VNGSKIIKIVLNYYIAEKRLIQKNSNGPTAKHLESFKFNKKLLIYIEVGINVQDENGQKMLPKRKVIKK
jgi:hypothetical protein